MKRALVFGPDDFAHGTNDKNVTEVNHMTSYIIRMHGHVCMHARRHVHHGRSHSTVGACYVGYGMITCQTCPRIMLGFLGIARSITPKPPFVHNWEPTKWAI